jgi:HEAT repeat protein
VIEDLKMEEELTVDQLIAKIKDPDDKVRSAAWLSAGTTGAPAVKPLAAVMTHEDVEIARAAKRGLWVIVRHVGRPGAEAEKKPVVHELIGLLGDGQPVAVRREVLWMLSEIGDEESVGPVAGLLKSEELREDARCSLERIPGQKSVAALADALESIPGDFKRALAHSLRVRGVKVDEKKYPCQKLVPTKETKVKPVGR